MVWLLGISLPLLGYLAYADFRYRTIPLWGIVAALIVSMGVMLSLNLWEYWSNLIATIGFAVFLIGFLWLWFKVRKIGTPFFDHQLGWGDVAMLGLGIVHFSAFTFMLWVVLSSFSGLIWYLVAKWFYGNAEQTIPLAGIMSLWLMPIQVLYCIDAGYYLYPTLLLL